ncbi:MAG: DUF5714 domain-containing protein [Collinsella sp.]|nr:DUF5714 domain-containing protein [Collinsella sp.]
MASLDTRWARETCLNWTGDDPSELLELLMDNESCPAFGPVHHYLVGAALLACSWPDPRSESLGDALDELSERAACVPGATCARWGVCGAAASCGMAFAILSGNAPLRPQGWSEGQLMVSEILERIARAGAPRCCKRDARIAIRVAAPWFAREFGGGLHIRDEAPACAVSSANSACLGDGCPYYRGA